jgi:hypothetical protein
MSAREARLRPEFAEEYPGILPDVWMSAGELAKSLVARVHARRTQGLHTRTFDPTHFEFRGGESRPRPRRTRSTDRSISDGSLPPLEHPGSAEAGAQR